MKRTVPLACAVLAAAGFIASPQVATAAASATGFVRDITNPYFPLKPGTVNIYTGSKDNKSALEIFEVTGRTKKILGVTCRVVHDRLYLNNALAEDTLDWFTQDGAGTVWYFGEATKELDPAGHVISTEGSFQAGVNGARQGVFMPGRPKVGATYQQEFYKGHAEDHFKILSLASHVSVPAGRYKNTMLTTEWTPLEPAVRSAKNYAKGVGTVLEADTRGGNERLALIAVLHE